MMLKADSGGVDYLAYRILGNQYFRMDPVLPRETALWFIKYIPVLLETAKQADLSGLTGWLNSN